jgi:hypothetical protein
MSAVSIPSCLELPVSQLALVDHVIHGRTSAVPESQSYVFNPATGEMTARLALGSASVAGPRVSAPTQNSSCRR